MSLDDGAEDGGFLVWGGPAAAVAVVGSVAGSLAVCSVLIPARV
jgi:hypothetical protein